MRVLQLLGYYLECALQGHRPDCHACRVNQPDEGGEQKLLGCLCLTARAA